MSNFISLSKLKSVAGASLKWVVALGLIYWLLSSGKISIAEIQRFLSHPQSAAVTLGCLGVIYLLAFLRWNLLLRSLGISLSYIETLRLGMLGQFFSSIIPGSVGGDLVKAVYIAKRSPDKKLLAISSIFMDRILGLGGMMVLGSIAFMIGHGSLSVVASKHTNVLIGFGWLLTTLAGLGLFILICLPLIFKLLPQHVPHLLLKLPMASTWSHLYRSTVAFKASIPSLWVGLGLSAVMHVLNVVILYLIATTIFGPMPWGQLVLSNFALATIFGLTAMALPVAPMGIGIGQIAFAVIFSGLGAPTDSFGASIITGMHVIAFCLNMTGVIFFATYKSHRLNYGTQSG